MGDSHISKRSPERWFDTSAFAMPRYGTFGSAGRNILEGPGFASVNASLNKNTRLCEAIILQLRAEIFNLLDRANFDMPDNFLGSPSFGRVLSANAPRRVQFGLKLVF